MKQGNYELKGKEILRLGDLIAEVNDDGSIEWLSKESEKKYRIHVGKLMKKVNNPVQEEPPKKKVAKKEVENKLFKEMGFSMPEGEIPPKPAHNPKLGDKDPEVMAWYRNYKPEEYLVRYKIKGRGMVKTYDAQGNVNGEIEKDMGERKSLTTAKSYSD